MAHYTCWRQRFNNYRKALQALQRAVDLSEKRKLSELEALGLIREFEFTHELAWNVLKVTQLSERADGDA